MFGCIVLFGFTDYENDDEDIHIDPQGDNHWMMKRKGSGAGPRMIRMLIKREDDAELGMIRKMRKTGEDETVLEIIRMLRKRERKYRAVHRTRMLRNLPQYNYVWPYGHIQVQVPRIIF